MQAIANNPLVSVIIPAFNAQCYVEKAINSVLAQSYNNTEIIVVNDGSQDKTEQLVSQYTDARVRLITQSNGGMSNARNSGINAAKGEFIAFLDADDYWMPRKLERQVMLLRQNPELGFCSTQTRVETPDGNLVNEWLCPSIDISTLHTIFFQPAAIAGSASSVLARRELQSKAGLFDESLKGLEDTDMWIRYSAIAEYCCIPETLTVILKRPNSVSRNLENMRMSAIKVFNKNRCLLDESAQKQYWRSAYASILCDFAKWEARSGMKILAAKHLLLASFYAPLSKGRLCIGLLIAIICNRSL